MNPIHNLPVELKFIAPYLSRSQETKAKEPLISYYCKLFAIKQALTVSRNPKIDQYVSQLLDECEKEKLSIPSHLQSLISDDDACYAYFIKFAFRVFLLADNEDRQNLATTKTARTFLSAANFMEVSRLFIKEPDQEVEEKIKYAKWKATDIIKSIKSGMSPTPGPSLDSTSGIFRSDEDLMQPDHTNSPGLSFGTANEKGREADDLYKEKQERDLFNEDTRESDRPNVSQNFSIPFSTTTYSTGHSMSADIKTPSTSDRGKDFNASKERIKCLDEAQKLTKNATSALEYEDIESAIKFLKNSLKILESLKN